MPLWQELPLLLVVAFCLAVLIRTFLLQAFFIPSSSMEETLLVGDRVLVNKVVYDIRPPERGEVVVFRGTDKWAPENFGEEPGGMLDRIGRTLGDLVGREPAGREGLHQAGDRAARRPRGVLRRAGPGHVNGVGIDEPYIIENSLAGRAAGRADCGRGGSTRSSCRGPDVRDGRQPGRLAGLPLPGSGADRERHRAGLRHRLAERPVGHASACRTHSTTVPAPTPLGPVGIQPGPDPAAAVVALPYSCRHWWDRSRFRPRTEASIAST